MKTLILFASTDGHTRRICRFAATRLATRGHDVTLAEAGVGESPDPSAIDAVLLAGSVHSGKVQEKLVQAARGLERHVRGKPTLYLQVSLSAAGNDPVEHRDLRRIADQVVARIGWRPRRIAQVAGAFLPRNVGLWQRLAMTFAGNGRDAAKTRRPEAVYTDWDKLGRLLDEWLRDTAEDELFARRFGVREGSDFATGDLDRLTVDAS